MSLKRESPPKKLRISYSLLSSWARGQTDRAIATYFHLDIPITPQMKEGKRLHKEIAEIVRSTGQFPKWLSPISLESPLLEHEVATGYNELFDVKSIFDCLDGTTLFEFKTGSTDSLDWSREMQIPFYFLVARLAKIPIKKAYLIRYNQYDQTSDFVVIWNNKPLRDSARNFIDTLAPSVHEHFIQQGLI